MLYVLCWLWSLTGLGVDLTTSVIHMLKPQHVIQIQSTNSEFNFPELLSPAYVCSYRSSFSKLPSDPLEYVLHTMKTMAGDKRAMSPWYLCITFTVLVCSWGTKTVKSVDKLWIIVIMIVVCGWVCSVVDWYQYFRGTCCYLLAWWWSTVEPPFNDLWIFSFTDLSHSCPC